MDVRMYVTATFCMVDLHTYHCSRTFMSALNQAITVRFCVNIDSDHIHIKHMLLRTLSKRIRSDEVMTRASLCRGADMCGTKDVMRDGYPNVDWSAERDTRRVNHTHTHTHIYRLVCTHECMHTCKGCNTCTCVSPAYCVYYLRTVRLLGPACMLWAAGSNINNLCTCLCQSAFFVFFYCYTLQREKLCFSACMCANMYVSYIHVCKTFTVSLNPCELRLASTDAMFPPPEI
jgi:hypothetical protein